ncbi:MAG TPA: hypothetical protein VKF84_08795 [Candidatus Sulfotelmatobacter sp.]|nr:hypothetical protein [Candidatus Sulfotelmatobacter sp.]
MAAKDGANLVLSYYNQMSARCGGSAMKKSSYGAYLLQRLRERVF